MKRDKDTDTAAPGRATGTTTDTVAAVIARYTMRSFASRSVARRTWLGSNTVADPTAD
jgi:hypothetical protein